MKFCTHCGAEIEDEAVICIKCGCSIGKPISKTNAQSANITSVSGLNDTLILLFAGIHFLIFFLQFVIQKVDPNWSKLSFGLSTGLSLLGNVVLILPLLAIRHKTLKIVGIIIIIIPAIYWSYEVIRRYIRFGY